ncbi:MAG: M61 family peptidase, partial [Bacteroidota bacterium]|nr:M61 family peptidase [Bacteroidota bacterium]
MTCYYISSNNPQSHFIEIEVKVATRGAGKLHFQLPSWRPGRYELANYAQNIQRWNVYGRQENALAFRKLNKDLWEVNCEGKEEVTVRYTYYANQLDAGASYVDGTQLYINPVNCCIYVPERILEPCSLNVDVPEGYEIATALNFKNNTAQIKDYHQLADSPFIASAVLQHETYSIGEYLFHIWIKGNARPDWKRVIKDFKGFTQSHIELFGELPVKEYHFLFQLTPHSFYHGVEHLDSTVICIGPGHRLMEPDIYTEFLGVSSHELFHSWNVKSIRPMEMFPYDYTKENYTKLGYVTEGLTTYYGDLMLIRGGVFDWSGFQRELNKFLSRYYENEGRQYMSLAYSSFDTWLDGYKPGVPDRKISMYIKGALVGIMKDLIIRKNTENGRSLDDVMRSLYTGHAKQKKGYSEVEYIKLLQSHAECLPERFFERFVDGLDPLEESLPELLEYVGLHLIKSPSADIGESKYGFKYKSEPGKTTILNVASGS